MVGTIGKSYYLCCSGEDSRPRGKPAKWVHIGSTVACILVTLVPGVVVSIALAIGQDCWDRTAPCYNISSIQHLCIQSACLMRNPTEAADSEWVHDKECCGRPNENRCTADGDVGAGANRLHIHIRGDVCTRKKHAVLGLDVGNLMQGWTTCCIPKSTNKTVWGALPPCSTVTAQRCRDVDRDSQMHIDPAILYFLMLPWFSLLPCHCAVVCLGTRRHGYCGEHERGVGVVVPIPAMAYAVPVPVGTEGPGDHEVTKPG